MFAKKSLEMLRDKVDLIEVLSSYLDLKRAGAAYKALCPFHEEKTPSFVVQRGDSHYHCFGCGAHGDAIAFLMGHLQMNFAEAVEVLADKFQIPLEEEDFKGKKNETNKKQLREALTHATEFYHSYLLHTDEGQHALNYLYERGLDLDFINLYHIGFAPKNQDFFLRAMKKFDEKILLEVGLLAKSGVRRPFFFERVIFPIKDPNGHPIGFSARKIKETTFGPKYLNTPETSLFKKSETLYGLSECRRRIAKEQRVMIVEGQIDALRLIQEGFDFTVAGQGTAFGQGHVKQLVKLGVQRVFLALDGDLAGREASCKIGGLFQKEGIDVTVIRMPQGSDPDTFLREKGPEAFLHLLKTGDDYLSFLVRHLSTNVDMNSPSQKNQLIQSIAARIREWEHPLMVHESLRKLAALTHVPEKLIGVGDSHTPEFFIKKSGSISNIEVNPDRVLETDLLRWLFLAGHDPKIKELVEKNIRPEHLHTPVCRRLFSLYMENEANDPLSLAPSLKDAEEQLLLSEILQKRINLEKSEEGALNTITKILEHHWLDEREKIRIKIQSGYCSEEEVMELARRFDELKREKPEPVL